MKNPPPNKYKLPDDLHQQIYSEIEDDALLGILPPIDDPTIILVGGQMGAGKSGLLRLSENDLKNTGFFPASINGDEFRARHPNYEDIFAENPDRIAEFTDADARVWTERVFDEAIKRRVNIVFETTLRTHPQISETIERMNSVGYNTQIRVVAASEMLSIQGIFKRYEEMIIEKGVGRWTSLEKHAEAYEGVLTTLDYFQKERLPNSISLYRRDRAMIFETAQTSNGWTADKPASEALREEREREWNRDEKEDYLQGWQKVVGYIEARQQIHNEILHAALAKEMLREAELLLASEAAGSNIRYTGSVIAVTPRFVFQQSGEGRIVCHDRRGFENNSLPEIGRPVRIGGQTRLQLRHLSNHIK